MSTNTSQAATLDAFTICHLAEWTTANVHENDLVPFTDWALRVLWDDPTLADMGWALLLRSWENQR